MDELEKLEQEARKEADQMADPLEVLLSGRLEDQRKEPRHQMVELPRLSEAAGKPVAFELRGMTHKEVSLINSLPEEDRNPQKLVLCCVSPDWTVPGLSGKGTGCATPQEAVLASLTPGEIQELGYRINLLSGFGVLVTRELANRVKNA